MKTFLIAIFCIIGLVLSTETAFSQVAPTYDPSVPKPTLSSIKYGKHERQVLDFWKAKSNTPTPLVFVIHGGGWNAGEKERVNRFVDVNKLLESGISVVSINYRLIKQANEEGILPPVKAPMYDAARALQYVRSKANEWNIDKKRIGAAGGSAGACTSLWLAYHDDLAEPNSNDLIERESTRLWCAAVVAPQTSLDPKQMKEWTPNSSYGGHAFGKENFEQFLADRESILPWIAEYSPYALVSSDDPPVYMQYSGPPALGENQKDPTHTANFGVKLKERCEKAAIGCELQYPNAPGVKHETTTDYLIATLKVAAGTSEMKTSGNRPNILFIAIDDLNDWVGCLGGHPQAITPNMDRLADRGTLFLNAQVNAPLCNPSRASLLTGMRPSSTGIYGLAPGIRSVDATKDCVSLPQYFHQQGYFTAGFGKVYHDGSIPMDLQKNELDVWGPAPGMPIPPKKLVQTPSPMRLVDWGIYPEDDRKQPDWMTADNAIAQLNSRPKDKPFFLAAGFRLPHVPCFASQKWFDMYPPEDEIKLPAYLAHDRDDVPFFSWYLHWDLPEPRLSWLKEANQWKNLVRSYLASTTFMDSQIGRLLDALDASGEASNTIIVLWSDNGWHLGEKDITGKNSLWKPSTRVPLIFAGPGVSVGQRCTQPAELLDIYPTLIDLCGLPAKSDLEGHSLKPQLIDAKTKRLWPAITTANQNNHAVVTDKYRFIQYADGSQELYDDQKDPNEWTNLASDPKYKDVISDLKKWLPKKNMPLALGSAQRILEKKADGWYWEGKLIKNEELQD